MGLYMNRLHDSMMLYEDQLSSGLMSISKYITSVVADAKERGQITYDEVASSILELISFFDDDPDCFIWNDIDETIFDILDGHSMNLTIYTDKPFIRNLSNIAWFPRIRFVGPNLQEISLPNVKRSRGTAFTDVSDGPYNSLKVIDLRSLDPHTDEEFPLDYNLVIEVATLTENYPALKELILRDKHTCAYFSTAYKDARYDYFSRHDIDVDNIRADKVHKDMQFLDKIMKTS